MLCSDRNQPSTPCEGCHAGCCRSFAIPLSGVDVMRLEAAGHTFWEFACRWADESGQIAGRYAPHVHFADDPQTPFVLGLLHDASAVFPGTPKCRFLQEGLPSDEAPLGVGRCGVYADRPAACRVFPKKLDARGELVQLQPIPPRGTDRPEEVFTLCPRPWTSADIDPIETPGEIAAADYEMRFFSRVVQMWNRDPGEWVDFPDFLRGVYLNRVRDVEAEPAPVILPFRRPEETTTPVVPSYTPARKAA